MTTSQPDRAITDNDYYHCGYLLGVVGTIDACAQDGCVVCLAKVNGKLPRD